MAVDVSKTMNSSIEHLESNFGPSECSVFLSRENRLSTAQLSLMIEEFARVERRKLAHKSEDV